MKQIKIFSILVLAVFLASVIMPVVNGSASLVKTNLKVNDEKERENIDEQKQRNETGINYLDSIENKESEIRNSEVVPPRFRQNNGEMMRNNSRNTSFPHDWHRNFPSDDIQPSTERYRDESEFMDEPYFMNDEHKYGHSQLFKEDYYYSEPDFDNKDFINFPSDDNKTEFTPAPTPKNTPKYPSHDPIYINGNADFATQAANEGWAGNGTEANPYIIENYDINASTSHGVYIRNTDVYFVIRNCTVHDGKSGDKHGIYLYNVMNGEIKNCTSYNNSYGSIVLSSSSNNNITNCAVYNNYYHGIWLSSSSNNNIISNCDVYNNSGRGIFLYYSPNNNTITDCAIHDNSGDGIGLYSSSNNTITNCDVYNNSDDGIYLYYSSNNQIHYNNIYNNTDYGVYNYNSAEVEYRAYATYNWWGSADGPSGVGPGSGDAVSYNVLYRWWLSEPGGSIVLYPHNPIYINGNDVFATRASSEGWAGDGTTGNPYIIEYYDINASSADGIRIANTDVYFIIRNCVIHDGKSTSKHGIYFYNVTNGKIENCTTYNNYRGIYLYYSPNNKLRGNILEKNNFGIYGWNISHYHQDIDTSNIINGKPLYYMIEQDGLIFDDTMSIGYLG